MGEGGGRGRGFVKEMGVCKGDGGIGSELTTWESNCDPEVVVTLTVVVLLHQNDVCLMIILCWVGKIAHL